MLQHSKVQKQILDLYRQFMKVSKERPGIKEHIRREFRRQAYRIPKTDVMRIEHVMRRGRRQLEALEKATVRSITVFERVDDKGS
ncbi:hypothetical protein LSH36_197g05010 [Paralvinella palmiformis]|uniref:Complex 1 LYR protein domain-containing protein n=1 Tax=Paralvinella palmiformis TaxID=53620 RepID=A0AAD9JQ29_9ANNE|nr:hypothetical protein LSH36_197g05010 [Paralvinella palmiformis]